MIEAIHIDNYKSIEKLVLKLGRVNVFIGENGAGKSNILEAIALAGAAQARKLDNEFLASRGIRVSGPQLMRSAFKAGNARGPIKVSVVTEAGDTTDYELTNDNKPYSTWRNSSIVKANLRDVEDFVDWIKREASLMDAAEDRKKFLNELRKQLTAALEQTTNSAVANAKTDVTFKFKTKKGLGSPIDTGGIEDFLIYAPENSALRLFEREGQIEPLGINGEGLLKLLRVMSRSKDEATTIKDSLKLFSWFEDFKVGRTKVRDSIEISDQFFDKRSPSFDQRSANEGFLFLAFYIALFTSDLTPRFFAVDNIDSSLNPKLCEALMRRLATMANDHGKQVLLTTHNPAILDGLNLGDPEHRLFVVSRGLAGQTRVRRFEKKPSAGKPHRLSELFLSGSLGGLPKAF